MPVYEIQAPNGKTYQIEGPEGASQEDIQSEVMRQNAQDFEAPEEQAAPVQREANSVIQQRVTDMMKERADPEEILSFIDNQGMVISDEDRAWVTEQYPQGQRRAVRTPPDEGTSEVGAGEAAWKGLQSGALFGFDDELAGISGAVGNKIGNALGMNDTTAGFWDVYDTVRQRQNDAKDRAWEERPGMFLSGFAPGMLLGPGFLKGSGAGGRATMRDYAAAGGVGGAISGAGNSEGGLQDRAQGAAIGGATGYVLGGASKPVVDTLGVLGNRVAERFRPNDNNLNSGLDALARRTNLDLDEVAGRAAELERLGVEPRLLDVVGEQGRSVISGAAGRATNASDDLARAADDVYVDAQDRIAQQARSRIAPESENISANQIADATETLRDTTISARMEDIRNEPVPITDEITKILTTREGKAALRGAQGFMDDPADKEAVEGIMGALRNISKLDPRLPPAARAQMQQQLLADANITVDIADKFARAMKGRGKKTPGLERVAESFARSVRDAAKEVSPEYRRALDDYEDAFRTVEAARGTGRFEGSDILKTTDPRQFADRVAQTDDARPRFVDEEGVNTQGVSTEQAFRVRAADDIARAAQEGSGSGALDVARRLARGSNQQRRNEALLGPEAAQDLQGAAEGELNRVINTRFIDPRIGSQTARRMAERDQLGDEVVNAAAGASLSWTYTMVRTVGRFLRDMGMKDVDAERLVRDAIDPERTNDALAYLVQRGMPKNKAMSLLRSVRQRAASPRAAGRVGGEVGGTDRPRAPRSIRAVTTVRRSAMPHVRVPLDQQGEE